MNKKNICGILTFGLLCGACSSVKVAHFENFDTQRYMGTWYEIARLDHSFERNLDKVTATYALRQDGNVSVTNRGYDLKKGVWREAHAQAVGTRVPNFFKVYFVPLIGGDYQVAYIDDTYSIALVSGGSTRYLWLLARTPYISAAQTELLLQKARALGYDTSKLIYPVQ